MNTNYYGLYIEDINWDSVLEVINNQKRLLFKDLLYKDDIDSIYLYNNYYIISYKIDELSFKRDIYNSDSGILYFTVYDTCYTIGDYNNFSRCIGSNLLDIKNNKIISVRSTKYLEYIKPKFIEYKASSNPYIGSFDIETYINDDGISKIYALGFCTGVNDYKLYYIDVLNKTSEDLLINCINDMLVSKYNNYKFYVHNGGNYDFIFMTSIIKSYNNKLGNDIFKMSTVYRNGNMLKLKISNGKYSITFIDSYNILNTSLDKLCKAFKLDVYKGTFPHKFVRSNTLNYVGNTPDIIY